jgi:hypothetical protein
MPDLVDIYLRSQKPRPVEAKQIPDREVNFIDVPNDFQVGFNTYQQLKDTRYTPRGLQFYGEERAGMVIPESFNPIEEFIQLHRYQPGEGYYVPGSAPGFG